MDCNKEGGTCGAGVMHKGTPGYTRRTNPKQRPTKAGWAGLLNPTLGPNHNISRMRSQSRVSEQYDWLQTVSWLTVHPSEDSPSESTQ